LLSHCFFFFLCAALIHVCACLLRVLGYFFLLPLLF
jgi:hypothetical protein